MFLRSKSASNHWWCCLLGRKLWDHFEEYLLVWSLMFSVALVFFQIVMRYVFSHSLSWTEELARYLFLWQVWLGASFAVKKRAHLKITVLTDSLSGLPKKRVELLALILWFSVSFFLAYSGGKLALLLLQRGQVSPAMRMPMGYAYASVPIGCSLMCIRLLEQLWLTVRKRTAGGEAE